MQNKSGLTAGSNHVLKPALLLDLDGTIRRSKSGQTFIQGSYDIEIIPGMREKILEYKNNGYLIAAISNQGSVAHGIKTTELIEEELGMTIHLLGDGIFDSVQCAYSMADGTVFPYNHRSLLRKPDVGMLALLEINAWKSGVVIDWDNSIMVGDRLEDYMVARKADVTFQHPGMFLEGHPAPDFDVPIHHNLNYDSFWTKAWEKWPDAVKLFCTWIDAWKKKNCWTGDKFHYLPLDLQCALLQRFAHENGYYHLCPFTSASHDKKLIITYIFNNIQNGITERERGSDQADTNVQSGLDGGNES